MDLERLNLSKQDQARIDSVFLDAAIGRANGQNVIDYPAGASAEVEAIHVRTLNQAHDDIISGRPLDEATVQNLGKLSFLDTLWIPTGDKISRSAPREARVITRSSTRRRLFADRKHAK